MAAANAPFTTKEALTLTSLGINPQFITFTNVTMESDKYICVRETAPQNSLVIIDMNMPNLPLRRPTTADSALMNPINRILALKAQLPGTTQDHLQIFNIEAKAKMKSHQMPEQVVFWKWITPKMLGLVTQSTVYHWSIEGDSEPTKMFDRTANLANNQIINYKCDPSEKWLVLIGIAPGSPERPQLVKGNMQLFSVDQQRSQALEAHAASFASFRVAGNDKDSILISFATKSSNSGQITSKLHVIELGAQPGKPSFTKKQADLFFPPDFADDFPVAMQLNNLELAVNFAKRGNLPGAENLIVQRFQELFAQTKYKEAAELAAESPQGILRTPDTVSKFQSVPVQAGQTPPLLQYFGTLLTKGKLNAFESLELSRLAVNHNKKNLLENWLAEDKLDCSEELGDLVKTLDNELSLKIYIKARATPKVVAAFAEHREFDKILIYSKQERDAICSHPCAQLCHVRECPPCKALIKRSCHCGCMVHVFECKYYNCLSEEEQMAVHSCKGPCHRKLPSCSHLCPETCHPGPCPSPDKCCKKVIIRCGCQTIKKEWLCHDAQEAYRNTGCDPKDVSKNQYGLGLLPYDSDCKSKLKVSELHFRNAKPNEVKEPDATDNATKRRRRKHYVQQIVTAIKWILLFSITAITIIIPPYFGYKGLLCLSDWMNE